MKNLTIRLLVLISAIVSLIPISCRDSSSGEAPKIRIVLIAKDQAFHLEGQPELPNPPITLVRGQTTELVLRNEDPSHVLHCLSISGLDVKTPSIDSGQLLTVKIRPGKRGTHTYACLMHPPMAGKLIVR